MTIGLTARQSRGLAFIRQTVSDRGRMPSHEELRTVLGAARRSTVTQLLQLLIERGWVRRISDRRGAYELVETASDHVHACLCDDCIAKRYTIELNLARAVKVQAPVALQKVHLDGLKIAHWPSSPSFNPSSPRERQGISLDGELAGMTAAVEGSHTRAST